MTMLTRAWLCSSSSVSVLRLETQVRFRRQRQVDRQQVVAAARLDAVAGIVDQRDGAGVELAQKRADGAAHLPARGVLAGHHVEAELSQLPRHQPRVVDRVLERRILVGGVADDQRHALVRRGARRRRRHECREEDRDKRREQPDCHGPSPQRSPVDAILPGTRRRVPCKGIGRP
jgi:hypothetical protein